jgi:signal transduction histidine kinase
MHQPLSEIRRAAERSADLTRQLLAFSRQIPQSVQVIDLNEAVIDARDLARRETGDPIEVVRRLAAEPCPVEIDPGQLDQILRNLIVNAREAMPQGGILTIETRVVTQAADRPTINRRQFAQLTIADTGIGMDSQTRVRIFEPFFTTKQHGTGLGLSIVFGIVQGCDGHIDVESEPRKGTIVKIRLPLARKVRLGSKP